MDTNTIQTPINSGFGAWTTAQEVIENTDLSGKVVIVTGGYSGIGLETTRVLAKAGARVIVSGRDLAKGQAALRDIPNVELARIDLMSSSSIDAFARRFISTKRPLHILINNAGIMATPLRRDQRSFEAQFSTNHLGHFQLTSQLWPALKRANGVRVVTVSSCAHRLGGVNFDDPHFEYIQYDNWRAYSQSKTANILFAVELDKRGKSEGVRAFSVHPGLIPNTDLGRHLNERERVIQSVKRQEDVKGYTTFKTIEQGAATSVWCAVSWQLNGLGGVYCEDVDIAEAVESNSPRENGVRPWAINPEFAYKLWELSEDYTGVRFSI